MIKSSSGGEILRHVSFVICVSRGGLYHDCGPFEWGILFEQEASQGRDAFVKGMRLSPETLNRRRLLRLGGKELALEVTVHLVQAALRVAHRQIAPIKITTHYTIGSLLILYSLLWNSLQNRSPRQVFSYKAMQYKYRQSRLNPIRCEIQWHRNSLTRLIAADFPTRRQHLLTRICNFAS